MPKYVFSCANCQISKTLFTSVSKVSTTCECGQQMERQLPKLGGEVQVSETIDKHRNISHKQDHNKIINDRKSTHYWTVEVPKMVASGTYSLETMLENGWVYYTERGELKTRNTPPEKI